MFSVSSSSGLPSCVPSSQGMNPYSSPSQTNVEQIYQDYRNNFDRYLQDRQAAFLHLAEVTRQSSDYMDFVLADKRMVRVMITYLDPLLIQYIVLNNVLDPSNGINKNIDDFKTELKTVTDKIAQREELLFVVTITAPTYYEQAYGDNVLKIILPIDKLALFNAGTVTVYPRHYDRNLAENVDISHGPAMGVVGYPISVLGQNGCIGVLDQWTTSLTLDLPSVAVGSANFDKPFWKILYSPPSLQDDNHSVTYVNNQLSTLQSNDYINRMSRKDQPPLPFSNINSAVNSAIQQTYWEDMGRYLWGVFLTEIYR